MQIMVIFFTGRLLLCIEICYTTEKGMEGATMNDNEQVKKYLEYCEFRKALD